MAMRYSTLLLASSIALHASDNHVAEATGAATSRAHTYLEMKNDMRPQRFLRNHEDDERMLPSPFLGKTPEEIFKAVRVGTAERNDFEKVQNILQTMEHENMEQALASLEEEDTIFISTFIGEWGIDAVATAFAKAKHSGNLDIAKKLSENLMRLWDSKGYTYDDILNLLKPNAADKKGFFIDGRVELLDDYIKFKSGGESNDVALFATLRKGFESYADLAHFISLSSAVDETVKPLETRFVKHFVDSGVHSDVFFRKLKLPDHGYKMLKRSEFNMVGIFLDLGGVPREKIPQNIVNVLINGLYGEDHLAIMLSEGEKDPRFKEVVKKYEDLLFQHLKDNKNIGPDDIGIIFTDVNNPSHFKPDDRDFAPVVKHRYQKWYAEHS